MSAVDNNCYSKKTTITCLLNLIPPASLMEQSVLLFKKFWAVLQLFEWIYCLNQIFTLWPQFLKNKQTQKNKKQLKHNSCSALPKRRRYILHWKPPTVLLKDSMKASCPMHTVPCSWWQLGSWTSSCWFIC